jgi:ABC-type multidrug transport system ATPase subunit
MKEVISFKNTYKNFKSKNVLSNLSFAVNENEFLALLGNNGCGKTTTINLLCNLEKLNKGNILVFEKNITSNYVSYRQKFGIVLSKPYYVELFSIVEYLKFCCKFQKVNSNLINQRVEEMLDLFALNDYSSTPIENLSSGLKMKVSIAASLIHNPDVLIYDEPFVNLDIQSLNEVIKVLKSLKQKKTLLITSHSLDVITDLCDRFIVLENGQVSYEVNKTNCDSIDKIHEGLKDKLITPTTRHPSEIPWLK